MSVALQHYLLFLSWKTPFLKSLYNFLSKKKHVRRIFSGGKIDMCQVGIFLTAADKFFPFILFKCVGESEFASCNFHSSSSIPPHTALLRSFARLLAVRSCCVASVGPKSSSRTQQSAQHTRARQHVRPSSHTQQSITTTLHVHAPSHAHLSHTLCFSPVTVHTDLFIFIMIYFSVFFFLFGINRSLCCTASFTLDEPSEWSGDLQTTKSRNNNIEKVSHPIVFAWDYRI